MACGQSPLAAVCPTMETPTHCSSLPVSMTRSTVCLGSSPRSTDLETMIRTNNRKQNLFSGAECRTSSAPLNIRSYSTEGEPHRYSHLHLTKCTFRVEVSEACLHQRENLRPRNKRSPIGS